MTPNPTSDVTDVETDAYNPLAEVIGTYFLVLFGCGAVAVDSVSGGNLGHLGISGVFGLVVAVMILSVGHLSGAHFNPAVTLSFFALGHFPARRVGTYLLAQCFGAIAAASCLFLAFGPDVPMGVTLPSTPLPVAFATEACLSFSLMFVIASVATDDRAHGQLAALAIGGAVSLGALVGGPLTGASMNPARSLGPALVSGELSHLWLYLAAPVIGALCGAFSYRWTSKA